MSIFHEAEMSVIGGKRTFRMLQATLRVYCYNQLPTASAKRAVFVTFLIYSSLFSCSVNW